MRSYESKFWSSGNTATEEKEVTINWLQYTEELYR